MDVTRSGAAKTAKDSPRPHGQTVKSDPKQLPGQTTTKEALLARMKAVAEAKKTAE